jgi:transmembrane sensor
VSNGNNHITDDLLVKYLLGEANATEQANVQQWIAASGENEKYFQHFKLIWDESKKLEARSTISADEAWERFKQRTHREAVTPRVIEMPKPKTNWLRAAAAIVLLLGCGFLVRMIGGEPEMIALQSGNSVLIDTLPDGSVVTLNKNSSISYPEEFDGDTREIALNGEAFFNVTPDKSKPFIITANEARVRVVGTSFNVKSSYATTEVIVETGVVEVGKQDNVVKLNPNEKAVVSKDEAAPDKHNVTDELYNYYRTKEFVCNNTPLWRLADVLQDVYGVEIIITDSRVRNLPLTTTFRNESLDSILGIIRETFNLTVERDGNKVFLK